MFGFRIANVAFNTQVQALMIAGAAMFLSRYASSTGSAGQATGWLPELSFPLPSQWLMSLSWLVALAVVALPAMVKLLPRIPGRGAERVELSISNYLQEFFSDEAWPKDKTGRDESHRWSPRASLKTRSGRLGITARGCFFSLPTGSSSSPCRPHL